MALTTNYYSITSGTVACNHQCRRRHAVANTCLLVAALVVGILPMLHRLLDCEGVPWCTSNTTDKSIKFTNFDANPLSYRVCLYWSTQTTSAINLVQPEEEQSTKEKRCNRWEELDSHNDVTKAAARTGKRDHSSMVATPILLNPKCLGAGMKGKVKRWTQQEITKYTGGEIHKSSQQQKNKSKGKIIIYDANITSRISKRQRRNNE
jgi:hypothetical protein